MRLKFRQKSRQITRCYHHQEHQASRLENPIKRVPKKKSAEHVTEQIRPPTKNHDDAPLTPKPKWPLTLTGDKNVNNNNEQNSHNFTKIAEKSSKNDGTQTPGEKQGGWTQVAYGRRGNTSRKNPVLGGCKRFSLQVAPKKAYIFLTGLSPTVTEEEVQAYIKNSTETDSKCHKMRTKNSSYRGSFKIEVAEEDIGKILVPEIWGEGIMVNHFTHARRSPRTRVN